MAKFLKVFCALVLLNLLGCARPIEVVEHHTSCKLACLTQLSACFNACQNSCHNCASCANQATAQGYKKYVHEKVVQGGFLARQLNSYRDPLKCRKITCDCKADYGVCVQDCNGVIHKRLRIPPKCC